MQKLIYLFILFVSTNGFSQITSGSIEYEVVTQFLKNDTNEDPFKMDDFSQYRESKSNFIMDFDKNYLRFYSKDRTSNDEYSLFRKKDEVLLILMPNEYGGTAEYYSTHYEEEPVKYEYEEPDTTPDTIIVGMPDSKMILGYNCKRTVFQVLDDYETVITVWSTEEIANTQGLVKLDKSITGAALEITISDKNRYVTQKATHFTPGNVSQTFSMVPPAEFNVSLPRIYVTEDSVFYSDVLFPAFIDYPKYKGGWKSLQTALEKLPSIDLQDFTNEYEWQKSFTRVFITLGANGELLDFHVEDDSNNEHRVAEVTKLLNKKGLFSPLKVEGQAVTSEIQLIF